MELPMEQSILKGEVTKNLELTFISLFKSVVTRNSTKTAILFEDHDGKQKLISFKNLDEISNRMAKVFLRYSNSNKSKNHIVAVSLKQTEYLPIILLAIMKAGLSYLPLDIEYPSDRVRHILQDAQPLMCILQEGADSSMYNSVLTLSDKQLLTESERESETAVDKDVSNDNIALILYTSGSTGKPKGVRLPYSALMNRLMWQWKELPYNDNENCCIFKTALTFVDSVCEIWGPLLQGRTLVVIPRCITKDPEKFINKLNKHKIQRLVLVPTLLKSLLTYLYVQKDKESLRALKLWVCSGETLLASLVQEFFQWFSGENKIIANFYGSTEIMGDVTFYLIRENDIFLKKNKIPIGKPVDNCIVYVVNQQLNLVPHGEIGELLIAGRNVADGYVGDNNSHKFINNPFTTEKEYSRVFRTGDFAKIDSHQLFYEGRQDNQVKIRGQRVDLSEIEKAVLSLPVVKDAVVLSYKSTEQILLCFIVPKQKKSDLDPKEIKFLLSKSLLSYMIPEIIIIDKIPLLINGKTDRQELLASYKMSLNNAENKQSNFDFTDVPTELMKKANVLFSTIASITGLKDKSYINLNANFYELGGNSLNSVYAVLKLREQGYHIGITDFIVAKTIKEILLKMDVDSGNDLVEEPVDLEYEMEMLNDSHKDEVIETIAESFFTKADLERWLIPQIRKEDYCNLMMLLWESLVEKNFSFVLKSPSDNKILSVALNFDARDEPDVVIDSKLTIIFEFLEFLEQPIREERLPKGKNAIFHTFMMATSNDLSSADNVILMRLMEQKCLEIAKKHNFCGILTTNTSPLTQQLGTDVFNYEVMLDYQVNQYVASDGSKPFAEAPDDQRSVVSWKPIKPCN